MEKWKKGFKRGKRGDDKLFIRRKECKEDVGKRGEDVGKRGWGNKGKVKEKK